MSPGFFPDLVFLVILVSALCWGAWNWLRAKSRERAAESWPTAEATIQTFYVVHHSDSHSGYSQAGRIGYIPVLQYSFVVNGERYSGAFNLGVWESTQDSAEVTGKGWVGERIRIRYKLSDPAISVWLEQDGAPAGVSFTDPYGSDDSIIDLELNK
jgi:hypothetical protein